MLEWDQLRLSEHALDWVDHTARVRAQLFRAQDRFKKKADGHRTERSFMQGDHVLLKLQPYVQSSVANRPCRKLVFKFFGPFTIQQKIDTLAYKLDLPEDARIHPVFHVSQLKPFTPDYTPAFSELPRLPDLTATEGNQWLFWSVVCVRKVLHLWFRFWCSGNISQQKLRPGRIMKF